MVGGDPVDGNLVVSYQEPAAGLDGGDGEALTRADVVCRSS